ncbi:helicase-related protein [Saccharopolyspora cebuensis]|uniref:Helicase-related protein n=1 Tax=Saccharopolyspora cebuensis TaxID=418759 RepID=A0ABV4CGY7_9PSEU
MTMAFEVGSLVHARGRDWVVLPNSDEKLLVVRPLGGSDDDVTGLLRDVETVAHSTFPRPDPDDIGNVVSAGMLRTALRIGFRATAGPFRSIGGLAVQPRPYQLVPLLMALRHDTVRLLIADDVGIGKTVEAGLIASELLAQGSARGLSVLCSPALAEQWQAELAEKFRIDAELVLPSTVGRLQRGLFDDESLFDRYPYTVVSTDFIKSPKYRDDFVRSCPDAVIVDEAHTSVADGGSSGSRTLRYELLKKLAADADRHLVLVTATPHSGKDEGFRNLIGLLDPDLATVDLSSRTGREHLARHMVQRRRGDVRHFLENTPFPAKRETQERRYYLGDDYRKLFAAVVDYARETVRGESGGQVRQRVRYWSALALLRALASSPKAAAATLRTRASNVDAADPDEADRVGRAEVLDLADDEQAEALDVAPGADDVEEADGADTGERRRLQEFARRAEKLVGAKDSKLTVLDDSVQALLADGYDPVVFCRFIDTAEYVTEHLRTSLGEQTGVECVTGALPPSEREARIRAFTGDERRHVLVATDCLSEGINLQEHFQAVVHYDLAWNPTRHEQREGRVDRYGQQQPIVRAVTIIGADNQIDEIVMRVLLTKHNEIRERLGVSVPVPDSSNQVVETVMEELLAVEQRAQQDSLFTPEDLGMVHRKELHREWDNAVEREKESQTKYAQHGIKPEEVMCELDEIRASLGNLGEVDDFTSTALSALGSSLTQRDYGFDAITTSLPNGLRESLPPGHAHPLPFHRDLPVPRRHAYLDRTDSAVAAIARHVLDTALDPTASGPRPARRGGVMRTDAVAKRTTLLLVRFRMHLNLPIRSGMKHLVAEEAGFLAYRGRPAEPQWLDDDEVTALLDAAPSGNVAPDLARDDLARAIEALTKLDDALNNSAAVRAERLRASHARVREAAKQSRAEKITVEPHTPVDVLGVYVYLPTATGGAR